MTNKGSTKTAHTPGPWRVEDRDRVTQNGVTEYIGPFSVIAEASDSLVAIAEIWNDGAPDEAEANASLIAAAPDLLAACKRLIKFNQDLLDDVGVSRHYPSADFARAAIARAEGVAS